MILVEQQYARSYQGLPCHQSDQWQQQSATLGMFPEKAQKMDFADAPLYS